jgi:predicted CXXCH cytochrome family protein
MVAAIAAAAFGLTLLAACAPGSLPPAKNKGPGSAWKISSLSGSSSGVCTRDRSLPAATTSWQVPASLRIAGKAPLMKRVVATPVADTVSSASTVASPGVPHPLADHAQCLSCHAVGTGTKPAPENHKGRTIDTCLYCHAPQEGAGAVPPLPKDPGAAFCLSCHGPFEAIAEKTKDFKAETGENANPHVFVPHTSKKIVSCTECHEAHELPTSSSTVIAKANLEYCFSCHHQKDFTPCAECHKD